MGGGGGGAQRPVWRGNEPKKTGARSARARTRGQNPLVVNTLISGNSFKLLRDILETEFWIERLEGGDGMKTGER